MTDRSESERAAVEAAVASCYETWSTSYYDEYYGPSAPYPPVHRELLRSVLEEAGAKRILDAGCGPASFLRDLPLDRLDAYGFDLTPSMVDEARRVLGERGVASEHVWLGSVLDPEAYAPPGVLDRGSVDAVVCCGVLPHVPEHADTIVLENLRDAVRPGGTIAVEARNALFALFTLNRYSHELFLDELVPVATLRRLAAERGEETGLEVALDDLRAMFRTDQPPVRRGADAPGYDEVLSRTHNPFVLKEQAEAVGLRDVRLRFYHFHALPPMVAGSVAELARDASLTIEDPDDWRGHFLASAFVLTGRRR